MTAASAPRQCDNPLHAGITAELRRVSRERAALAAELDRVTQVAATAITYAPEPQKTALRTQLRLRATDLPPRP